MELLPGILRVHRGCAGPSVGGGFGGSCEATSGGVVAFYKFVNFGYIVLQCVRQFSKIDTETHQFWRNRHPKSLYFGYAHASPHNRIYSATSARYGYVALAYLRCPTRSCPPGPNICSSRTRLWTAPRAARALRQRQNSHGTCTCHTDRMRPRQGPCLCEAPARASSHGGKARTPGRSLLHGGAIA